MKIFFLVLLTVVLIVIGPLLTIWSLNTLFPVLAIAYGFHEWIAVILLGMFIRSPISTKK